MEEHLIGYAIQALIDAGIVNPVLKEAAVKVVNRQFEDQVSFWWHIIDVQEHLEYDHPDLSDDDAREILQLCKDRHDCNYGMTWDSIDAAADQLLTKKEVV